MPHANRARATTPPDQPQTRLLPHHASQWWIGSPKEKKKRNLPMTINFVICLLSVIPLAHGAYTVPYQVFALTGAATSGSMSEIADINGDGLADWITAWVDRVGRISRSTCGSMMGARLFKLPLGTDRTAQPRSP
jgi:hypothetical protein